jgi:hypothetical protein
MKPTFLFFTLAISCVEPPATDKAGDQQPDGAATPGAPEPGAQPGPGDGPDSLKGDKSPGPGAIVPDPGPGAPKTPPEMALTQDDITDGVTISGTLACEECAGELLVRVEDAGINPPQLLTVKKFAEAGDYTIKVPKNKKVVVMVVHDANGDEQPSPGESIGLWTGGLVNTSTATAGVDLTVGVMPEVPPIEPEEPKKPDDATE